MSSATPFNIKSARKEMKNLSRKPLKSLLTTIAKITIFAKTEPSLDL
jgi:hypothetical protein